MGLFGGNNEAHLRKDGQVDKRYKQEESHGCFYWPWKIVKWIFGFLFGNN